MKKLKTGICVLSIALIVCVCITIFTACNSAQAVAISLKPESIETTVLVGSEHDLSTLVLKVTYDDGENKDIVKNKDMDITPIDTTKLGKQDLTIKYLDLQTKVEITVVAHKEDLYTIMGFETPSFYTEFKDTKKSASKDIDINFALGDSVYKVGDDNAFKFLPIITAVDDEGNTVTITEYTSKVTIKENEEELTGENLSNVVSIDNTSSTFDFTPLAIGRTFDITVEPLEIPDTATYGPITFSVEIVDGWNVYNEADLSRVESNQHTLSIWADKKAENNIDDRYIKSVVLHNNLEIKKSDLPSDMFYPNNAPNHEGLVIAGTLKDSYSFYTRDIPEGETFSIYGNYFSIKTKNTGDDAIPMTEYLQRDGKFSHSAMFSFGGDNNGNPGDRQGNVYIENLSLKGNGSRESGASPNNHRALIGIISSAENFTMENCLTRAFTTHLITLGDYNYPGAENITNNINNTKMIDSFQASMLAWASRNNYINDSIMKESGGPLIVTTHNDAEDGTHEYANIIAKNSKLESLVGGAEAWFVKNGATEIITQLDALNVVFNNTSSALKSQSIGVEKISSFKKDGKFNFIAINMEDDAISNTDPIESKTKIIDMSGNVISHQDMMNKTIIDFVNFNPAFSTGDITKTPFVFECGGSFVTFDINKDVSQMQSSLAILIDDENVLNAVNSLMGTDYKLIPISLDSWQDHDLCKDSNLKNIIVEKIANFFNGNYVNLYMGGQSLGATFEMFHIDI